jgi:hypothetical protein
MYESVQASYLPYIVLRGLSVPRLFNMVGLVSHVPHLACEQDSSNHETHINEASISRNAGKYTENINLTFTLLYIQA